MDTQLLHTADGYRVTFSPADREVGETEKWLIAERQKTGDGFYPNGDFIKNSFAHNELATISIKDNAIGFATWRLTTDKTARIGIAEVKPTHLKKGIGETLTTQLLNFLADKGICVVDLQCSPETSEPVWRRLGFVEFPDTCGKYKFNSDENKKLYKILDKHLETSSVQGACETINLWNDELYKTTYNTSLTYPWNVGFIYRTSKLSGPIFILHIMIGGFWRTNGKTIKDDKIKYFKIKIGFENFIILDGLPVATRPWRRVKLPLKQV